MNNLNQNEAKKNFFFEKKKIKMADSKIWVFQLPPKAEQLSPKFYRLVLGLVGLIDVKGIDVAQPIWPILSKGLNSLWYNNSIQIQTKWVFISLRDYNLEQAKFKIICQSEVKLIKNVLYLHELRQSQPGRVRVLVFSFSE